MISNSLITKGLSVDQSSMVAKGFPSSVFQELLEVSRRVVLRLGRSGRKASQGVIQRVEEVVIHASLFMVNEGSVQGGASGWVHATYDRFRHVVALATRLADQPTDDILITAKRLR